MAKIKVTKIAGGDPEETLRITPSKTAIDDKADIRDTIASLITRRQMGLGGDGAASYTRLRQLLGDASAQKLMNHILVFNSRPELGQMSPENRLTTFYNTNVTDPETEAIVKRSKAFGYGVLPGFRSSNQEINQIVGNRLDLAQDSPVAAEKIKIRVAPKMQ